MGLGMVLVLLRYACKTSCCRGSASFGISNGVSFSLSGLEYWSICYDSPWILHMRQSLHAWKDVEKSCARQDE
jgi:hypothetical protein